MIQKPVPTSRTPDVDVDPAFYERWSPRSFHPDPIPEYQVKGLFEAARWSPSCYNDQPWVFIFALTEQDRVRFLDLLVEQNRLWAKNAPLLLFIASRIHFTQTGKVNNSAPFDAGSAWMAFALQARKFGLYAHAMAGFDKKKAYDVLDVPREKCVIHAAIAVGRRGDPAALPENLRVMEKPNERKPLSSVFCEGRYVESGC